MTTPSDTAEHTPESERLRAQPAPGEEVSGYVHWAVSAFQGLSRIRQGDYGGLVQLGNALATKSAGQDEVITV